MSVVHAAAEGHVGVRGPDVARGCVDVHGPVLPLKVRQTSVFCAAAPSHVSVWARLLPGSILVCTARVAPEALLMSLACAAAEGFDGVCGAAAEDRPY